MQQQFNQQYTSHVLYQDTSINIQALFSLETILLISKTVTENLRDIIPQGIVVPLDIIANVLNALYEAYRPPSGDPMTMYNVVSTENPNAVDALINQTVNVISQQIRDQLIMEKNARNLSAWTTVLGENNKHGLRSHPPLKIRHRKPQTMMFNMPL